MLSLVKGVGGGLLVLVLFLAAHFLIYATAARFWPLPDPTRKLLLILVMLLGCCVIPSALLLRTHPSSIAGIFYAAEATWLGFFLYLLPAALSVWGLFLAGKLFGIGLNMRVVLFLFFALAGSIVLFGVWRAGAPRPKIMDVTLSGLPDAWRGKTVVQLSDVHLGTIRGPGFMERVADQVNALNPDLILITGDLFDGMGGNLSDFIAPLNRLQAKRGVFFVTGNHEGYLGLKEPLAILARTRIRILDNEVAELSGLQIVGIPYPVHTLPHRAESLFASPAYDPEKPSILMYHTPTDIGEQYKDRSQQQTNTYWQPDTRMAFAQKVGIDLQLSGHTHGGQFFPFTLLTRRIFNGYHYGLHREGNFQIYTTSGVGTWGPPLRILCPPEIPVFRLN